MFCSKCGCQIANGERFCRNCGCLIENTQMQNTMQNPNLNGQANLNQNYSNFNPNYVNNVENPNMKKWAILSILIPSVAIIWYTFIGLSFYIAIFIGAAGFEFAKKGEIASKKMALTGRILNGILCGLAIVMLIINLIVASA